MFLFIFAFVYIYNDFGCVYIGFIGGSVSLHCNLFLFVCNAFLSCVNTELMKLKIFLSLFYCFLHFES